MTIQPQPQSIVAAQRARAPATCAKPGSNLPGLTLPFARNQEIYVADAPVSFIYRVVSGAVRTVSGLRDGRRQVAAFYLPGEVFGLEAGGTHHLSAEAVTETQLALTSRSVLEWTATRDHEAVAQMWSLATHALARTQDHLLVLGRMNAGERVASFLIDIAERSNSGDVVNLPMGRGDIADYLGLTIETISRTLHEFEERQLIALPNCRMVKLLDVAKLQSMDAERTRRGRG